MTCMLASEERAHKDTRKAIIKNWHRVHGGVLFITATLLRKLLDTSLHTTGTSFFLAFINVGKLIDHHQSALACTALVWRIPT